MKSRYALLFLVLGFSPYLAADDRLDAPGPGYRKLASPGGVSNTVDGMPVVGDRIEEILKRLKDVEERLSRIEKGGKNDKKAAATEPLRGAKDPGDIFVQAYMKMQQAEKAAAQGDLGTAVTLLTEADKSLARLQEEQPNWQPAILEYRRGVTAKRIAELQKALRDFANVESLKRIEGNAKREPSLDDAKPEPPKP